MESALVEENVMLLMIYLQQLACLVCTFGSQSADVVLRLLRCLQMNFGPGSHGSQCARIYRVELP